MNFFELYQIPVNLRIDTAALRKQYLTLSKQYHPDFHTLSDSQSQEEALDMSGLNNKAYETLKNEDKRIKYILDLNYLLQEGQDKLPSTFLMEMMDINESMMELQMEPSPEGLIDMTEKLDTLSSNFRDPISKFLDADTLTDADLQTLKTYYLQNKYLSRLKEGLDRF